MTGPLVESLKRDFYPSIRGLLGDTRPSAPIKDKGNVFQARAMLLSCVQTLLKGLNYRWDTESDNMRYKKCPRLQLRDFCPERSMTISLDARRKLLCGVLDTEPETYGTRLHHGAGLAAVAGA